MRGCCSSWPTSSASTSDLPTASAAGEELARLGLWAGQRPSAPRWLRRSPPQPGTGEAVLAGWRMLLDDGRLQDGEPHLAGTARPPVARLSAATAAEIGAADGDLVTVRTDRGAITLPLAITDMPDRRRVAAAELAGLRRSHRALGVRRRGPSCRSGRAEPHDYPDPTLVRPRPVVAGAGQGARASSCS